MKNPHSLFAVLGFMIVVSLSACLVDYAYRHNVTGTVFDTQGNPVPDVTVSRSPGDAGQSLYGETQKITDNQGRFVFLHEQLGSRPKTTITWILTFEHPDYKTKQVKIDLYWTDKDEGPDYGYVKKDIIVQLYK